MTAPAADAYRLQGGCASTPAVVPATAQPLDALAATLKQNAAASPRTGIGGALGVVAAAVVAVAVVAAGPAAVAATRRQCREARE